MEFVLADGTSVTRAVGECEIAPPQGAGHTPVVLGAPGDAEPPLGVVTLEILGLVRQSRTATHSVSPIAPRASSPPTTRSVP